MKSSKIVVVKSIDQYIELVNSRSINQPITQEIDQPLVKEIDESIVKEIDESMVKEIDKPLVKEIDEKSFEKVNRSISEEKRFQGGQSICFSWLSHQSKIDSPSSGDLKIKFSNDWTKCDDKLDKRSYLVGKFTSSYSKIREASVLCQKEFTSKDDNAAVSIKITKLNINSSEYELENPIAQTKICGEELHYDIICEDTKSFIKFDINENQGETKDTNLYGIWIVVYDGSNMKGDLTIKISCISAEMY